MCYVCMLSGQVHGRLVPVPKVDVSDPEAVEKAVDQLHDGVVAELQGLYDRYVLVSSVSCDAWQLARARHQLLQPINHARIWGFSFSRLGCRSGRSMCQLHGGMYVWWRS